eukprot:gb/GECH01010095.1/.p1 GENE.gb/GECH01010095.1/~~gb/GECH01010095.1/.p1  ORF type:complete len:919 (+),score=184.37 gb/GECH01010095.1/:1-2757(+)
MSSPGTDLQHILGHLQHYIDPIKSAETPTDTLSGILRESVALLQLFAAALEGDAATHAERFVLFSSDDIVTVLLSYITHLPAEPNNDSGVGELLLNMRVHALAAFTEVISLAHEYASVDREMLDALADSFRSQEGHQVLLTLFKEESNPDIRASIAEALYAASCRLDPLQEGDILDELIDHISSAVIRDRQTSVRNYCAAILRDFGETLSEYMVKKGIIPVSVQLLHLDPSPDVRVLACETLDALFRNAPESCNQVLGSKLGARTAGVLYQRLQEDGHTGVVEGVCRVLETVFHSMMQVIVFEYVRIGGWKALIRSVGGPIRTASLAVRALRHLVLISPGMGTTIVTNFSALSTLLKSVHNHAMPGTNANTHPSGVTSTRVQLAQQLLKVELATLMGVILAQNPANRTSVHEYLEAFPVWMSNLRTALLKNLAGAETEYFSDIDLADDSDYRLIDGYHSNAKLAHVVRSIFQQQEKRFAPTDSMEEKYSQDDTTEHSQDQKEGENNEDPIQQKEDENQSINGDASTENLSEAEKGRVIAAILSWSIHLTLSSASNPLETSSLSVLPNESTLHNINSTTAENRGSPNLSPVLPADERSPSNSPNASKVRRRSKRRQRSKRMYMTAKAPITFFSTFTDDFTPAPNTTPRRPHTPPSERDALKIHKSLSISIHFSQFYQEEGVSSSNDSDQISEQRYGRVKTSRRQTRNKSSPFKKRKTPSKSWRDEDVEVEDVFYYRVPVDSLTPNAMGTLIERARKHVKRVRNHSAAVPIQKKGRRSFLYDMEHYIMPAWIQVLEDLHRIIDEHSDRLRMAIKLYSPSSKQGFWALEPNNTLDFISFLQRYFSEVFATESDPEDLSNYQQVEEEEERNGEENEEQYKEENENEKEQKENKEDKENREEQENEQLENEEENQNETSPTKD